MNAPLLVSPKRCAVYCRVSSDERLDQSFNSIDAQKEAGHAFIKSQSHEGWIAVADDYDDGGFSGGNMERPALKRLMADIQLGKVDIVVVYKIDRLSRSLADFARMVDVFDRHRVSFSAVTQQINSLTLVDDLAQVHAVVQHLVDGLLGEGLAALGEQALRAVGLGHQRGRTHGHEVIEDAAHQLSFGLIDDQ